jgi:predicted nucleic acid-binding protein
MRIYLNLSAWNRPFDDWSEEKIIREAKAVISLLERNEAVIIASEFAIAMIKEIRNGVKYKHVSSLIRGYSDEIVEEKEEQLNLAERLQKDCKLSKLEDSIHIVLAGFGNADYFVTTDSEIIKKRGCIERYLVAKGYKLKVVNPLDLGGEIR